MSKPPIMGCEVEPLTTASAPPELYTYADVAGMMRVEKQTVYEWVKKGRIISPIYAGHSARFTADMLADIIAGPRAPGTYTPAESPRAEIGMMGYRKKVKAAKAKKKPKPKADPKQKPVKKSKKKPTTTTTNARAAK